MEQVCTDAVSPLLVNVQSHLCLFQKVWKKHKFGQACLSDISSREEAIVLCEKWEYSPHFCGGDGLTLANYQAPTQLLACAPLLQDGGKIEGL